MLDPVQIGGVTVKSATLHNIDYIENNDIRIGDVVLVTRAGDVIPRVVGPAPAERTGRERRFQMPDRCPVCGSDVDHPPGEVMARCTRRGLSGASLPSAFATSRRAVRWTSKVSATSWPSSSPSWNSALDIADVYKLDADTLALVPRTGPKTVENLLRNVGRSKARGLARLLYGLGIRFVGAQTAQILAGDFGTIDAIARATRTNCGVARGLVRKSPVASRSSSSNARTAK